MSFGGSLFGNAAASTTTPATSSAGGGFGNIFANAANASKPATPSLFGTTNTASSAPASGGLFGSAQPATPAITLQPPGTSAPTTNLFGNANPTSAPAAAPSLFGNATAATPAAGAAGNLFASAATTSATPSGGLFGNANASSAAPSGGLFGSANAASAAPSGGLFGNSTTNSAPAAGGLFGASTTASQPAPAGNLFGSTQQASGGQSGLFGGSTNNASAATQSTNTYKPLFGSLGTATAQQPQQANQTQQQPQVVQGVRIDLSNVKPTTRFYELHESLQNEIIQAEEFIQSQINLVTQCGVFMPAHGTSLTTLAPDVKYVQNTLETVSLALSRDAAEINAVKGTVHQDAQDSTRAFTAVEHLKLPAQWQYSQGWGAGAASAAAVTTAVGAAATASGQTGVGDGDGGDNAFAATDMVPYFNRQTADIDERLQRYRSQLAEIEAHLRTVEGSAVEQMRRVMQRQANSSSSNSSSRGINGDNSAGSSSSSTTQQERGQVAELASAMHVFEDAVLRVAGKVGEAREGVIECTLGRVYPNNGASSASLSSSSSWRR